MSISVSFEKVNNKQHQIRSFKINLSKEDSFNLNLFFVWIKLMVSFLVNEKV